MSATLGGFIKDLRLQKNISQLEIAFALGWKEPSRLSRIEQGKVGNPPRDLLDKLMDAMRLTDEEKNQLLAVGNYLPTKEEVEEIKRNIGSFVDNWPYPATCIDYTWRLIYSNKKLYQIHDLSKKQQESMERFLPNILEAAFAPDIEINKSHNMEIDENRRKFLIRMLIHFRFEQKERTKEKWYQKLISKMMNNNLFRELWVESQKTAGDGDVMHFSTQTIAKKISGKVKFLNFYFFLVPVLGDPRFFVELYTPADKETISYFKKG